MLEMRNSLPVFGAMSTSISERLAHASRQRCGDGERPPPLQLRKHALALAIPKKSLKV